MAANENRDLLMEFINTIWNEQKVDHLGNFIVDDYVEHTPLGSFNGLNEFQGFVSLNLRAFPDFSVELDNVLVDGNFVACNYLSSGTHEEEYMGIEATGNYAEVDGCYLGKFEDGELVEGWNQFDVLALLMAMEVITPGMVGGLEDTAGRAQPQ